MTNYLHRLTIPNQHRRARFHNYSEPGTYLITMVVAGRLSLLGELQITDKSFVRLSPLGLQISETEIYKINHRFPMIEIWETCIMPDHIHIVLHIDQQLPGNKHLGHVIGAFKGGCTRAWWKQIGYKRDQTQNPLFEEGYNDGILMDDGQLESWFNYVRDNPRRLAMKRTNPDLFKVWHNVRIGDWECQMIGNIFMMDIPDKMAVIVHRADSDECFAYKYREWMACGERGGILVSAAVAPREKLVMREAMNRGYRLILLRENGFNKYYKPSGASFDACAKGSLLQICPWEYHNDTRTITRAQCLELNALALALTAYR